MLHLIKMNTKCHPISRLTHQRISMMISFTFVSLHVGADSFKLHLGWLITFPFEITLTYTEEGVHSVTNYSLIGDGLWQMYQVNFVFLL